MKLILEINWSSGGDEGYGGTDHYAIEDESVKEAEDELFSLAYACITRYLDKQEKEGRCPRHEYEIFHFHKIPIKWQDLFFYNQKSSIYYKPTNIKSWHYSQPKITELNDWFEDLKKNQ